VTQVQGDTLLVATITHAGCCLLVIVPVTRRQLCRNWPRKACDMNHGQHKQKVTK